jgi:hypothetical protein
MIEMRSKELFLIIKRKMRTGTLYPAGQSDQIVLPDSPAKSCRHVPIEWFVREVLDRKSAAIFDRA